MTHRGMAALQPEHLTRERLAGLALIVAVNGLTYYGSRLLMSGAPHYDLTAAWDRAIPFVPWTSVIYLGCYLFWIVNYVIGASRRDEEAWAFLAGEVLAKLICLLIFLLLPTTNVRPAVEGTSLFDALMRFIYAKDAPDNLFPSIHCLVSWYCVIAVRRNKAVPLWYRGLSVLLCLAVCLSTLTTKQHILIDVIGGVALAELSFRTAKETGLARGYGRVLTAILANKNEKGDRIHE